MPSKNLSREISRRNSRLGSALFQAAWISLVLCYLATAFFAQANISITGVVHDTLGGAVAGATVEFRPSGPPRAVVRTATDAYGRFAIDLPGAQAGTLSVSSTGFLDSRIAVPAGQQTVDVELTPRGVSAIVTVTRTQARLEDAPASVIAITKTDLDAAAASTVDDKLRQVPGFSLFRRAGSRTANPTTQGVSLRGVGASGASRALVLVDGVPLNDPFGSWIYWGRVPAQSVSQIEVLRGTASDLYGTSAIGGVVSVVTNRASADPKMDLEAACGSQKTPQISAWASAGKANWLGSMGIEAFRTDGSVIVDKAFRGLVDTPANVRRLTINPTVERRFGEGRRIFASGNYYEERRANGTPLQTNDTRIKSLILGVDEAVGGGVFSGRLYASSQDYHQSFSSVAANRASESLNRSQTVPAQAFGFSGQWLASLRRKHSVFAGVDGREVRGRSDETAIANGLPGTRTSAGGREFTIGVFAGANVALGQRLVIGGGIRFDRWQNFSAYSSTFSPASGFTTTTIFAPRSEEAISPRLSALVRMSRNISFSASASLGFRQPTLNELYRSFRVGDVLTTANENLRAERAASGEAGIILNGFQDRTFVRANVFCTEISRTVANVTLSVGPTLIIRRRQNLGRTRSCGLEVDAEHKLSDTFRVSAGYLFVDPRVVSFPANPALENLVIPQVARHQFTFQAQYSNPKFALASVQYRASSSQVEDDQNLLPLGGYGTVDALISRRIGRGIDLFAAAENLFNSKIETGRTPVLTIAGQRAVRLGIRVRLGKADGH